MTYTFPSTQGQWNRENLYYLDGIINTAAFASSYDVPPIIDTIQEFKIQSHNDQAEYGGVLGGVVNVVTKRHEQPPWSRLGRFAQQRFDSRNPFTDFTNNVPSSPASFRQNEFGGDWAVRSLSPSSTTGAIRPSSLSPRGMEIRESCRGELVSPTADELNGSSPMRRS